MKGFYREDGRICLQPGQPIMDASGTRDVDIEGEVVGLIRRLVS